MKQKRKKLTTTWGYQQMIEWNYYCKRRNVNLVSFIKGWDIQTYEQLVEVLKGKGINPPQKSEFDVAHKVAMPKIITKKPAAKAKAPTPKKQPTKRRGRPRKK